MCTITFPDKAIPGFVIKHATCSPAFGCRGAQVSPGTVAFSLALAYLVKGAKGCPMSGVRAQYLALDLRHGWQLNALLDRFESESARARYLKAQLIKGLRELMWWQLPPNMEVLADKPLNALAMHW